MRTRFQAAGNTAGRGFTLIEVVIAIMIFMLVMVAVFHYFSGMMSHQEKLKEKYRLIRVAREAIDSFLDKSAVEESGSWEKEGFLIKWEAFPAEDKRRIPYTAGATAFAQLKLIHLTIHTAGERTLLAAYDFLINDYSTLQRQ